MASSDISLIVNIASQLLSVKSSGKSICSYPVSTARNGVGQIEDSERTPLGMHRIVEKIGANTPENAVFVGRQWNNEVYTEKIARQQPDRDWILSRILWLDGMEPGFNSGMTKDNQNISCDSKSRYIYIHGCPDSEPMQIPGSHGCIRMRNADIIQLFDLVEIDSLVSIVPE